MKGSFTFRPAKWLLIGCMIVAAFAGNTLNAILFAVLLVLLELGEIRDLLDKESA